MRVRYTTYNYHYQTESRKRKKCIWPTVRVMEENWCFAISARMSGTEMSMD